MAGQPLTERWGMDGKKRRYRLTQIIMSPLFWQILKITANTLKVKKILICRTHINIVNLLSRLSALAT